MKNRFINMETIISPPTLTKKKCYEQFKQETLAWAEIMHQLFVTPAPPPTGMGGG